VANEGAAQRIAKLLHQPALLQTGLVQAQITLSLCGKVSSARIPIEGQGFCVNRPLLALPSISGSVQENVHTHFPQVLEFVEKPAIGIVVLSQQANGLPRRLNLTPISHWNHGQAAIKGLYDCLIYEKFRSITR
jgi:hypothetical protein